MLENVILTQCEDRIEGTSVVDQLALSFRPAVIDGIYRIRIHEHEAEKSFIDNAELILVDHPVGYDAVIDAKGKVVLGRHRIVPVRVVDDLGQDVLQQLLAYDSDAYTREGRGSLVATFEGRPGEFGALAAAGEPKPLCKVSAGSARPNVGEPFNLTMEVLDVHGEWHELPRVPLRLPLAHERSFVDLSSYDLGSETKVRYSWDSHIELDELSIILEESVGYSLRTIPVSRVTHSSDHRTARLILREDGENAELVTGEFVDLEFPAQPVPDGMERSFILKAKGYYLTWYGEETANRPLEFGLNGNYPNPFNPSTTIRYSLAGDANVTLEVFNILGQRVRTLLSGELQVPGSYKIMWEGRDDFGREVGSGAYLIKLQANDFVETRKAIMLK